MAVPERRQDALDLADEICKKILTNRELEYAIKFDRDNNQEKLASSITEYQKAKINFTPLINEAVAVIRYYNICLAQRLLEETFDPDLKHAEVVKNYESLQKEMTELKQSHKQEITDLRGKNEELIELVGIWKGKFQYVAEKLEGILKIPKTKKDDEGNISS